MIGTPPLADREPEIRTAELLEDARAFIRRYVVLPGEAEAVTLALFVAHTHAIESAHATPYLIVLSPERRTGKSLLLEVLDLLVSKAWRVSGASEAAMFRKIAQDTPTLLLDEVDAIFGTYAERTEPLRAVLNAGNRPGSCVARCVGKHEQAVVDFDVFCPKVLAGIDTGRLPDTIRDRGVELRMKRKTPAENVDRFRVRAAGPQADQLQNRLSAWAEANADALREAEPALPDQLNDRAAEAWEALFAIADLAGGDWPQAARDAAISLAEGADTDEAAFGTRLLAKMAELLHDRSAVTSDEALTAINADEELPFGGWRDGRGLDARTLARLLKPYRIRPRTVRTGDSTARGYHRDQAAEEAFDRYLDRANTSNTSNTTPYPSQNTPHKQRDVSDVSDVLDVSVTA